MKRWWNVGHVRLHLTVTLIQQVCRENEKCSKSWLRIKFPQQSHRAAGVSAVRKTLEKAGDAKFLLMFYFRPRVYWTWRLKTMRVVLFQSWLRKPEQNYLMTAWKWKFRGIDLKIHFRDRGMHLRNSVRRERFFGCCRFVTSSLGVSRRLKVQAPKKNENAALKVHGNFYSTFRSFMTQHRTALVLFSALPSPDIQI